MNKQEFEAFVQNRVVLLDGATGTNLYKAGMPRGTCPEAWILEHSEKMKALQQAYIDAGSEIIYAPTFGANRAALSKYGLDSNLADINARLIEISRDAVRSSGKDVLIAGDFSPTGLMPESLGGEDSEDEIFEIYREQASAVVSAGVDLIGIETMISLEETEIALDAVSSVCDLPVMCSLTVNENGRTFFGSEAASSCAALSDLGAAAVGINCSVGPDQLEETIGRIKKSVSVPVIAKPNAGLPEIDRLGQTVYAMQPEEYVSHMKKIIQAGAGIIGGCCGTTPEFIRLLKLSLS